MQRFPDQPFRDIRPIGVRRIDKIDAKFGKALQRADGLVMIGWRPPYA